MSKSGKRFAGSGSFARGIHPADRKFLSADAGIEPVAPPPAVAIPLLQHIGAPCEPAVKARDAVTMGQLIGKPGGFVSAPVHASVAGVAQKPSVATLPNGRHVKTIPIKAEGEQLAGDALYEDLVGGDWATDGLDERDPQQVIEAIAEAGLVGLGGAAFPTHVKLTRNEKKPVDTLLVNGCECEPYLTADYRLMIEAPAAIVAGAIVAAHAAGAGRVIVAIEDNKPLAIESMKRAAGGTGVAVAVVETKYPMGGERQVIPAVLDREVPTGGLPLDVGVVAINVGTSAAIARAVLRGKPLTHRVVTVSGDGVVHPKNLLAPIGISYRALIDHCGGLKPSAVRVVAGGPMMGFALGDLDTPITKGTSGVIALTADDVRQAQETSCIRCGRCVDVCPLNLVPTKMALAARDADWELARRYYITACCECGCCAYICPAGIRLVQLIRTGKARMPKD